MAFDEPNYWKRIRRRQLLKGAALGAVGGAGLIAVGCGDDDTTKTPASGGTSSSGGTSPAASPTPVPLTGFKWLQNQPDLTAQPKPGGALKYGITVSQGSLDPVKNSSYTAAYIYTPVYSRLFRPKFGSELSPYNPWTLQIQPDLAASSESPTAGQGNIKIRPNVKWQNVAPVSGRAFTADDVKYTLDTYTASAEFNTAWLPIDSVTVPDSQTVSIKLKQPVNYLIPALAEMRVVMLPKEVAAADGDFSKRAIGTGPFILDQYTPNSVAHFTKNPDYYVAGKPYVNTVEYVRFKDATTARQAYLTGQFPVGAQDGLGADATYKDDLSQKPDGVALQLDSRWQAAVFFLGLKTDKPPFNNPMVAQALSQSYDRKAFAKTLNPNLGANAIGNFTWIDYFDKQPDLSSVNTYDVANAKKLLSAAGVTGTVDATIDYAAYGQGLVDGIQFIAEQSKAAGFNLTPKLNDIAAYGPKFSQGQFDNMALGFIATVPRYTPLTMKTFLESTSGRNALKINDPDLDAQIKTLTTSTDQAAQKSAYQAIWNKVHLRPYLLPMLDSPVIFEWDKTVHNWLFNQYSDPAGWGQQSMLEQVWLG
ncbi:MAG: ABC transporter substrate-binding protein [Chloroflexota bacterium]